MLHTMWPVIVSMFLILACANVLLFDLHAAQAKAGEVYLEIPMKLCREACE